MKLGVIYPQNVIGGDPTIVRDFAQTAEGLGYSHIVVYDHVLGVNPAAYPDWRGPYTSADLFHDPFTLFSYMAGITERIEFSPQIVILPQRQAVLVAKQAASLDVLSGGRLRLGIGIGWNEVEYVSLGQNFHDRGRRSEEQIAVMRALWADPHVVFEGQDHTIPNAGINPLPTKPLEIWIGGGSEKTYDRIGRLGDGWLNIYVSPEKVGPALDTIRAGAEKAGRDPNSIGLECWVGMGQGTPDDWRAEIDTWRSAGATHIAINTIFNRGHIRAIKGTDAATPSRSASRRDFRMGIDTDVLKEMYSDRICFHGAIDVQMMLPFSTSEEVRYDVAKRIYHLGRGGGYILAPCHNIGSDVPPENVEAMYQTVYEYGRYPLQREHVLKEADKKLPNKSKIEAQRIRPKVVRRKRPKVSARL